MSLKNRIAPEERRKVLKQILNEKHFVRVIEAHNGLSAIIANNIKEKFGDEVCEFDALWESSLTDSASKGYPDADIVGSESRYMTIKQILNSSTKPLIVDGDTGGEATNFEYFVRELENMGVSMVIIEDKIFPKRNSLDPRAKQTQEDPNRFAIKIQRGKNIQLSPDFMIAARIESFIAGAGLEDALFRAKKYLNAGVDAIMIHSKSDDPKDIFDFAREYQILSDELGIRKPLICVPTTYNTVSETELREKGFNIVIYANHLLRAAHKIMKETALNILKHGRAFEVESMCSPVNTIFEDVGFIEVREKDLKYKQGKTQVIIPAAGKDLVFDIPKSAIKIKGKEILVRQREILRSCGLEDITVVKGYKESLIDIEGIKYVYNTDFDKTHILHSLFKAEEDMNNGFIYLNSDILFDKQIIDNLLNLKQEMVLVVDNSYTYHKHDVDKKLDLVLTKNKPVKERRMLYQKDNEAIRIGKNVNKNMADYEFTGIAYFSEYGANIIKKIYQECATNHNGPFHEAESFEKASFTDFIQEIIDRGFKVHILEVYKGWFEIHNKNDIEVAEKLL
ncbi:MAG: phosphoenolpyruvate mutase [Promethearchaeota archaeon]